MPITDLAIIGAGPAGSSAAITAARGGASVLLFDAHSFPRQKVCGEFVSAEALEVVADLLRDVPAAQAILQAAPVIDRTRLLLGDRIIEAAVSPAALSIARYDLDALLWDGAIRAGVCALSEDEVTQIRGDGPFTLTSFSGVHTVRTVVVAAGRWSQFTGDRAIPPGAKWIGLKAHFHEPRPDLSTDLYFFQNGYCGVQPVSENVVNACAMVRSDVATSFDQVFALHPALSQRAAMWHMITPPVSTAPLIYRTPEPVRGDIVHVGDAAAFIDPFVGDGISIALRSGRLAAESLQQFWKGDESLRQATVQYSFEYRRQFAPLLRVASQVRGLLSLPGPARAAAFELMRLPGVIPFVIRKTRRVA